MRREFFFSQVPVQPQNSAGSSGSRFGYLTDRFGRKKLFLVTLGLYLAAMRELEARSVDPGTKSKGPAYK